MIVERRTYKTKVLGAQEVADFLKEVGEQFGFPNVYRVYVPVIGRRNVVYHDIEFADLQEREQYLAAFYARPEFPEWAEKWKELVEPGGWREILRPVE
jgi:hypothetical protein